MFCLLSIEADVLRKVNFLDLIKDFEIKKKAGEHFSIIKCRYPKINIILHFIIRFISFSKIKYYFTGHYYFLYVDSICIVYQNLLSA